MLTVRNNIDTDTMLSTPLLECYLHGDTTILGCYLNSVIFPSEHEKVVAKQVQSRRQVDILELELILFAVRLKSFKK